MESTKQIVVLKLGDVQYGFPIVEVKEIIKYMPPTPMPNTSCYIEGVISLRGLKTVFTYLSKYNQLL